MAKKDIPRYDPIDSSLSLAELLSTLFFKLSDHGLAVQARGGESGSLGKLLYTLTAELDGTR